MLLDGDVASTVALDLTGNDLANTIQGNAGANALKGGASGDALYASAAMMRCSVSAAPTS